MILYIGRLGNEPSASDVNARVNLVMSHVSIRASDLSALDLQVQLDSIMIALTLQPCLSYPSTSTAYPSR